MGTFGEWLRGQRSERRLSREEFANRVGCSVAMLRKLEGDERRPSTQIAELIAACLEVPSDQRGTFVKVARGELPASRLESILKPAHQPDTSPARLVSRNNLPVLPTPLIGRQHDVDTLRRLLRDPQCQLVTLVGPGGIGKTRLAIETASGCQLDFADGAYFVSLATVHSSRLIIPVIAGSIGFVFHGDSPVDPKLQLFNYLSEKEILLVVDNFEHLIGEPEVMELFFQLMQSIARLKLLVTSRESLGLQSEWVYEVHGLPVPVGTELEGTAVELFLQRARRAHVGFGATTEDVPAILHICRLVNGMPLGIELAAAWVRTLTCEEIAREIQLDLDFLSVSAKDLPARHRSMRAVFSHSWKLLTDEEQQVLLRLSIFQGGFSRDAAQHIAGATLSIISALVTKSLIRRSGTGRYDLHELIRQYAFEQLERQPAVHRDTEALHGRYFLTFLAQEDPRLRGLEQRESIASLTADMDNIRSAQEWALAQNEFSLIETTLRSYSTFIDALGWIPEGLEALGRVKGVLESKSQLSMDEQVALAHVLSSRSLFAFRAAKIEEARTMLDYSLAILGGLNSPWVLVEALTFRGVVNIIMGNLPDAAKLFTQGLQLARDINDQWHAALCLTELIAVNMWMGKTDDILEQFQSAVKAWRVTGDLRFTAFGLSFLGLSATVVGKYDEAYSAFMECIAINSSVGDRWGLGNGYRGLALVAQAQGDHSAAIVSFNTCVQIFTDLGANWELARVLSEMGWSIFALGNNLEAEHQWHEALRLAQAAHGTSITMDAIVGLAALDAKREKYVHALQLITFSLNHPSTLQDTKARAEKSAAEIREKLTQEEIDSAQTFAESKTLEAIVQEIMEQAPKNGANHMSGLISR